MKLVGFATFYNSFEQAIETREIALTCPVNKETVGRAIEPYWPLATTWAIVATFLHDDDGKKVAGTDYTVHRMKDTMR